MLCARLGGGVGPGLNQESIKDTVAEFQQSLLNLDSDAWWFSEIPNSEISKGLWALADALNYAHSLTPPTRSGKEL